MPSLIQQSRRRLLALVWNWLARPLSDVSLAYEEAEGRLHKALVAVFSPALFIYYLMFQNPEVSPYTCLYDLPPVRVYEMRLVAGEWVPFTRQFSFQDLAGEPVIIINIATKCSEVDRNYEDLQRVQMELASYGQDYIRVLGFPCNQFLRQTPESISDVCQYVQGRGTAMLFFDKVKVNGRDASPIYNFLKQASGDSRPIEWNFVKFLVGPDGRTVKRYAPLTLVSEVLADYYQMRVAADDLDYLPSTFDKMMPSNVPVTGRWRRRLNPAANAHAVQALVMASAILALILYPASAASSHPPRRAAVDGTLLAAAVVLLLDTLARFLATALPYSLASLGFWVGIFTSFSLALDITFFAEEWAAKQTHWKILTAIRAARVARVMRLYAVVMHWRRTSTPSWTSSVRYPDPRNLARILIDRTMLKVYLVIVVSAMIAAPYLEFDATNLDEVVAAMDAISAVVESESRAGQLGFFNGTNLTVTGPSPRLWSAQALVLCNVASAAGPTPVIIRNVLYGFATLCATPADLYTSVEGLSVDDPGPFLTRQSSNVEVVFSVRDLTRREGKSTLVMITYTILVAAALSIFFNENVDREVVRPLEWVGSMLSMKTAEAYNTLKRVIAIDDSVEANMEPTERMMYQLSRLVLCFRGLAYSQKEDALMDRYLAGEDGTVDQATRQWLLGQTGQIPNDTAIESAGLQFVLARTSTTGVALSRMSSSGMRGAGAGGPAGRNSQSTLVALRGGQSSGRDDAGLVNRLSQSGFLPFMTRSNRSDAGGGGGGGGGGGLWGSPAPTGSIAFGEREGSSFEVAHPPAGKPSGKALPTITASGTHHAPAHLLRRPSNTDDGPSTNANAAREFWEQRRASVPNPGGGLPPAQSLPVASPSGRNAISAPRAVRRELMAQNSSVNSSVSILEGLAQAWNRSRRETGDRVLSLGASVGAGNGTGAPTAVNSSLLPTQAHNQSSVEKSSSQHGGGSMVLTGGAAAAAAAAPAHGSISHPPGSPSPGQGGIALFGSVNIHGTGSERGSSGDAHPLPAASGVLPSASSLPANGPFPHHGRTMDDPWSGPLPLKDPQDIFAWGIDLFEFGPMELCRFAFAIFEQLGAIRNGYCSPLTLWMFIVEVSNMYHANPFHNFRHAVDVLQTLASFLKTTENRKLCSPLEMFVMAVAALGHDIDHPGVTNAFLINTSDPLALLYNDAAVLENHHVASLFRLFMSKPSVNVLSRCDKETLKGIRKIMLEVVLHTDMSKHFSMVSKAELFAELHMGTIAMAARGDAGAAQRLWTKGEDRTFAMALLLHAADVSNPAKPLEIQEKWAHKVMQEFFKQGDREAELGLPISPGFDRRTASLPSSQLNFIEFVVMPLYSAVIGIFPELSHAMTHLQRNYADYVDRELDTAAPKNADGAAQGPDVPALLKRRSAFNRKVEQGLANAARAMAKHHGDLVGVTVDAEGNVVPGPPGATGSKGGGTPGRSMWTAAAALLTTSKSMSRLASGWKNPDGSDKEKPGAGSAHQSTHHGGGGGPHSPSATVSHLSPRPTSSRVGRNLAAVVPVDHSIADANSIRPLS